MSGSLWGRGGHLGIENEGRGFQMQTTSLQWLWNKHNFVCSCCLHGSCQGVSMGREETMWSLGCRQQVKGRLKIILLCLIHSHLILKQALSRRSYSVSSHSMLSKKLPRTASLGTPLTLVYLGPFRALKLWSLCFRGSLILGVWKWSSNNDCNHSSAAEYFRPYGFYLFSWMGKGSKIYNCYYKLHTRTKCDGYRRGKKNPCWKVVHLEHGNIISLGV